MYTLLKASFYWELIISGFDFKQHLSSKITSTDADNIGPGFGQNTFQWDVPTISLLGGLN